VQAQKKNWFFRDGIANSKFSYDHLHGNLACTDCHGGVDGTPDRTAAHAGMTAIPGASTCAGCHAGTAAMTDSSLHTTVAGYEKILAARGVDLTAGSPARLRYDKQCIRCHAAIGAGATAEAACGQCHISVPDSAGGGLIAGHRVQRSPDMVNNCTACHGSRVKDEYLGSNAALYARNRANSATVVAGDGFAGAAIKPDAHYSKGMTCNACHPAGEMHGQGVVANIDRYGITGRMGCTTCHAALTGSNSFHSAGHLDKMACQLCHSQPYKNCFSCHTQEAQPSGAAYFTSNGTDPTRLARRVPATWSATVTYAANAYVTYNTVEYRSLLATNLNHLPDAAASTWWVAAAAPIPAGDALIAFKAGVNPQFGVAPGAKKYAVLRHVPVDADVFTYDEEGTSLPGLIPNLTGLPTWKFATPHNIQRLTAITADPDGAGPQTACGNCHSTRYARFWLTDGQLDAYGWGGAFDAAANAGVVQAVPPAPVVSQ